MNATQIVDLIDKPVSLAGRDRVVDRVVRAAHVDALGRTHTSAEFAADALLHAVFVTIENMTAV